MTEESFVSVVIPAYNQAQYLFGAIESVLTQTYKEYEIIVVDDGSTDNTPTVAKQFSDIIRYIHQENQGLAGARNTGIQVAKGELISLLDADDQWLPDYLQTMVALVNQQPEAAVYYCCAQSMDAEGNDLPQVFGGPNVPPDKMYETLLRADFLIPSTIMLRKSVVKAAGLFDPTFRRLQDGELWIRLLKKDFRFIGIPDVLVRYRIHSTSLSNDPSGGQQAMMALAIKHFGPDDGQPQTWSNDKRRAYGGVYRYHVLTSVQRQNDWNAASSFLRQGLQADPTISTDLDLFYDLAHGNQPVGYRGTSYKLDFESNAEHIINLLNNVFTSNNSSGLDKYRQLTFCSANYALGLVAYQDERFRDCRNHLLSAVQFNTDLIWDGRAVKTLMKSILGESVLKRMKILRGLIFDRGRN